MTPAEIMASITLVFQQWSAGRPGEALAQVYLENLAKLFSDLEAAMEPIPGWAAATGTATRTTFDTATVTLPQLAQRVKAMIDDDLASGRSSA